MKIIDIPRSGSYADKTSSRNRAGQYVRNRRAPVQPVGTGRRAFIRSSFGSCSQAWSALSDAQRAAWSSWADGYPYVDSLGQAIKLTGHQMFVAINTQLLNCNSDIRNNPPEASEVEVLSTVVLTASVADGLEVSWDAGAAGTFVTVALSRPMSPGRSSVAAWWQAGVTNAATVPYDPTAAFVAEFGAITEGQKVFVKVTPVNEFGVTGVPVIVSAIVGA